MSEAPLGSLLVDAVIAITVLEALLLTVYHQRTGRGIAPSALLPGLVAGVFLMLGLSSVLAGAAWPWLAASLACAGIAHGADVVLRWPRRHAAPPTR